MSSPVASVVVPAFNAAPTLPHTLEGLTRQELDGAFEVVVVDDGSSDATPELAQRSPVVSQVIRLARQGPGRARNAGARASSAPVLAFLDADCEPTPGWLRAGVAATREADFVQGKVVPDPAAEVGPFDRTLWVTWPWGLYESANLFISRELFEELGGFESWLGQSTGKELGEDVWLGWRARRRGARMAFCDDALAYHAVFPRRARDFVAERWRLRYFPALARRVPELREHFFHRRLFLSRRSALFDLALAGIVVAAGGRRPLAAAAATPYVRLLLREGLRYGWASAPRVMAAGLAADAVGLAALAMGSLERRSLLL